MFHKQVQKADRLAQQGIKLRLPTCSVHFFVRGHNVGTIYYRVLSAGKRSTTRSTGIKARSADFNTKTLVIAGDREGSARLANFKASILRVFAERQVTERSLEPDTIRDIALGLRSHDILTPSLIEGLADYLKQKEQLLDNGLTLGSLKRYRSYRVILERFVTIKYGKDVRFDQLKPVLENDLLIYLKGKKGFSHNYALKIFQFLKTVLEYAVSHEWADRNVLRMARLRKYHKPTVTLTMDDLKRLEESHFVEINANLVKDVFLFCCYTGMAYADVAELQAHHIVTVNDVRCVLKSRHKSGVQSFTPLFPDASRILERYADNEMCQLKGVMLPVLSNVKMNKWLKIIGNITGIRETLHTHLARKTFTMYAEELGFSLNDMATMLGHSHTAMTEKHYYQRRREPVIVKFKSIFGNDAHQAQHQAG